MEEKSLNNNEFWVEGVPATFATEGEKSWKGCLLNTITSHNNVDCSGLELKFYLPTLAPNGHPLDVDNLCEPVFSVLIGRLGWFQGKRPNLQWWCASKEESNSAGLRIIQRKATPLDWEAKLGEPIFDAIYNGDLPRKATDPRVPEWIADLRLIQPKDAGRFTLRLMFSTQKLNIGEIADGRVKNLIDCLYPIVGGSSGNPDDWRIDSVLVQKGVSSLPQESVRVSVWRSREKALS
jgi:hypothetical protein